MSGVALDGFDQIRDEIEATLELHVDLGPSVLDLVSATNQAVVGADDDCHDDNHPDDDKEKDDHRASVRPRQDQRVESKISSR